MRPTRAVVAAALTALTLTACGSDIPDQPIRTGDPQPVPTALPTPTPQGDAEAAGGS